MKLKKYIFGIFCLSVLLTLSSCEKDPDIWMSSTTEIDGNWFVRYDHTTFGEDPFVAGYVPNFTYNTASNNGNEIWIEDQHNFWDYKVRIPFDKNTLTFGSSDTVINQIDGYDIKIIIENGQIFKNAVTLPSTLVVDSIYYEIWFEDLEGATGIANDRLQVGGYMKTGFSEDIR